MTEAAQTPRRATVHRRTNETTLLVELSIDGTGSGRLATGLPFFDHLLDQLRRHGLFNLVVQAEGDLQVDGHHTVEDSGLALGQAFKEALGDKSGVRRFASAAVPLDEALAQVTLDLSGRPFLVLHADFPQAQTGGFELCLVREFLRAFITSAGVTLHAQVSGENSHHMAEALFKALGRALDDATRIDQRVSGVPSTKGQL